MANSKIYVLDYWGEIVITTCLDFFNGCLKAIKELVEEGAYYKAYYAICIHYTDLNLSYNDAKRLYGADVANHYLGRSLKTGTRLKNAMNNLINYATN